MSTFVVHNSWPANERKYMYHREDEHMYSENQNIDDKRKIRGVI